MARLSIPSIGYLVALGGAVAIWLFQSAGLNASESNMLSTAAGHGYTTEIVSRDPLMIYINNFIRLEEVTHLVKICNSSFNPSLVYSREAKASTPYRTSTSCIVPSGDKLATIIERRALSFIGFVDHAGVEAIQLVRYEPGGRFALHNDWFTETMADKRGKQYNRIASFFIYLETDFEAGHTYFPRLPAPPLQKQSDTRFSTTENATGLAILPPPGSGVFWMNLHENGTGDERTLHAGMPVRNGTKIGMNIWIKQVMH